MSPQVAPAAQLNPTVTAPSSGTGSTAEMEFNAMMQKKFAEQKLVITTVDQEHPLFEILRDQIEDVEDKCDIRKNPLLKFLENSVVRCRSDPDCPPEYLEEREAALRDEIIDCPRRYSVENQYRELANVFGVDIMKEWNTQLPASPTPKFLTR